jgi:hypothetical protein
MTRNTPTPIDEGAGAAQAVARPTSVAFRASRKKSHGRRLLFGEARLFSKLLPCPVLVSRIERTQVLHRLRLRCRDLVESGSHSWQQRVLVKRNGAIATFTLISWSVISPHYIPPDGLAPLFQEKMATSADSAQKPKRGREPLGEQA